MVRRLLPMGAVGTVCEGELTWMVRRFDERNLADAAPVLVWPALVAAEEPLLRLKPDIIKARSLPAAADAAGDVGETMRERKRSLVCSIAWEISLTQLSSDSQTQTRLRVVAFLHEIKWSLMALTRASARNAVLSPNDDKDRATDSTLRVSHSRKHAWIILVKGALEACRFHEPMTIFMRTSWTERLAPAVVTISESSAC